MAQECICILRWNRTSEVEGDLWPANEKGRGLVHRPLVFKNHLFRRREGSPGLRELEQSPKEKRLGWWRTEIGMERKERPVATENQRRYTPVA
ncbi:hypothetical protein TNCV_4860741 [Trichonephila clavipes]|nr:hypothetical protein TNCV_4860741 [Trichonephila clavipes]